MPGHPDPDARCRQCPLACPLRAADSFRLTSDQRVQCPVLGSGNMPQIEAEEIHLWHDAGGPLFVGEIICGVMKDGVHAGALAQQQFWRVHTGWLLLAEF